MKEQKDLHDVEKQEKTIFITYDLESNEGFFNFYFMDEIDQFLGDLRTWIEEAKFGEHLKLEIALSERPKEEQPPE